MLSSIASVQIGIHFFVVDMLLSDRYKQIYTNVALCEHGEARDVVTLVMSPSSGDDKERTPSTASP